MCIITIGLDSFYQWDHIVLQHVKFEESDNKKYPDYLPEWNRLSLESWIVPTQLLQIIKKHCKRVDDFANIDN